MPQPIRQVASALQADALQHFAEQQEFAFAEVGPDGRIHTLNPFARLCWGWREDQPIPDEVLFVLEGMREDGSEVLPVKVGGLTLTGVRRGTSGGWVIIGYEILGEPDTLVQPASFDAVIERMPVSVVRMSADGTVMIANPETSRFTGYPQDEIVGNRFWHRIILPEFAAVLDDALRSVARKQVFEVGLAVRTRDARVCRCVMHLFFTESYEVEAVILPESAGQDGVEASSAILEAVNQGPEGFLFVDSAGVIRYANHRVRELIGIVAVESWLNRLVEEAPGFDRTGAMAIRRCLRDGEIGRRVVVTFVASSGMQRDVFLSIAPVMLQGRRSGCAVQFRLTSDGERSEDLRSRYRDADSRLRELVTASPDERIFLDAVCRVVGETAEADRVRIVVNGLGDRLADAASWSSAGDILMSKVEQDREVLFIVGETGELYVGPDPSSEAHSIADVLAVDEAIWRRIGATHASAYLVIERLPNGSDKRAPWGIRERGFIAGLTDSIEALWNWIEHGNRYRFLVDASTDLFFCFEIAADGSRRYRHVSGQIEPLTGIPPLHWTSLAIQYVDWVESVVHTEDRSSLRAHDRVLEQGVASTATYRVVHLDGTERWVRERAFPSDGLAGAILIHGVVTDITDRRLLESRMDEARVLAESAVRQKTSFIATLSHEVRTPIGAIQGYAELLSRELRDLEERGIELPAAIREFVSGIDDRSKRLTALVQDLFDLSSIELGQATVQRVPVVVHDVVKQCASKMMPHLRDKGITMRLQLDSRDPKVLADPRRLEQILDGLISNAVKFTSRGSVTVKTHSGKREVTIEVVDTGIGIAEAYQDQLFTPFTQEDDWRTRRFDGTGLGLSLVKRLLDLLGGRIEVESRQDVGSTFRVILPAVRGPVTRGVHLPRAERS